MFPAYRPQEPVALQAFEAMIRTIGEIGLHRLDFVITAGDDTDNAQRNELDAFLALLDGGVELDPAFGVAEPHGHPSYAVSGDCYNPEPAVRDRYKHDNGFPDFPGLLEAAAVPFRTEGLGVPWLACFGNHDCLAQGRAPVTPEFQARRTTATTTSPACGLSCRVVVLASHHGLGMLTNALGGPDADLPRYLAADIEAILHRFGNVVLWIAGHEHRNAVTPHPGPTGGFWHLITSGLCEWPCQARHLELLLPEPGPAGEALVIRSTMIDHAAPVRPAGRGVWDLAAIRRELAANEPSRVGGPHSEGGPADRNAELVVPISSALAVELRTIGGAR